MTRAIEQAARKAAHTGTVVTATNPTMGPVSIESHTDEALAAVGIIEVISADLAAGTVPDGYAIACFGDPGLDAARELSPVPVVGIAQAAFYAAALLGRRFAIITTLGRTLGRAHDLLVLNGFEDKCVDARACELPVLAFDGQDDQAYQALLSQAKDCIATANPDAIVLGCAGMAPLCTRLSQDLGIPVVDGVVASVGLLEMLAAFPQLTGASGEFSPPPPKVVVGLLSTFTRS